MRRACFILLIGVTACGPRPGPDAPVVAPGPTTALQLAAISPMALAAAGDTLYYADLEGVWAMPAGGGDARLVTNTPQLVQRIVPYADQLFLGVEDALLVVPASGGAARQLYTGGSSPFVVDDGGVWFIDGHGVRVVSHAGGEPRTVASGLGDVDIAATVLTTDGDAVYVSNDLTDDDHAPVMPDGASARAIWRVAKRDGARTQLAGRQYGVAGLVRHDDRLYWTSFGAGLRSVPATGGPIRTELGGGGVALAADADGIVVQTTTGLLVEVRAGIAHLAGGAPDRQPEPAPGLILAAGAVVALVTDHEAAASALWRLPRPWSSDVTVVGWVTDHIGALKATGDGLLVLDAPIDDAVPTRILHLDARGRRRVVVSAIGIDELTVAGDTIAYRADSALWRSDGGAAPVRVQPLDDDEEVLGLTLAGDAFYWSSGQVVRTAPARGGTVTTFHEPAAATGGSGRPSAELVVDGTTVYYSTLGWGSLGVRRVTGPEASELLFEPAEGMGYIGSGLVQVDDALYVSVAEGGQVWKVAMKGGGAVLVARDLTAVPASMIAVADRLVGEISDRGAPVLAVLDAGRGKLIPVLTLPGESSLVLAGAVTGDAVFAGLYDSDLIVRVPLPPR